MVEPDFAARLPLECNQKCILVQRHHFQQHRLPIMDFGIILENVLDFHQQQSSNLKVATEIMKTSLETKSVPDFAKIDPDVQLTMLYTVIAAHAVIVLLIPRLRRFVFGTIESILVLAVLLCLVAVVLGLPFGESNSLTWL